MTHEFMRNVLRLRLSPLHSTDKIAVYWKQQIFQNAFKSFWIQANVFILSSFLLLFLFGSVKHTKEMALKLIEHWVPKKMNVTFCMIKLILNHTLNWTLSKKKASHSKTVDICFQALKGHHLWSGFCYCWCTFTSTFTKFL